MQFVAGKPHISINDNGKTQLVPWAQIKNSGQVEGVRQPDGSNFVDIPAGGPWAFQFPFAKFNGALAFEVMRAAREHGCVIINGPEVRVEGVGKPASDAALNALY